MNILIWSAILTVLVAYVAFTVVLYFVRFRPLLQARRKVGADSGESVRPSERIANGEAATGQADALAQHLSQDEWRYTFDAIPDTVLILDRNLTIVRGNRAAYLLLSVNGAAIEGKPCHQLFAGLDLPCAMCPVRMVRQEKRAYCQEITHRYLGRTFSVTCSPIDANGELIGFILSAKDISHQRSLERQLIHAHKLEAIATLAGGIAHDFNNILGAILGNADLLLYRLPTREQQEGAAVEGPAITFDEVAEYVRSIRTAGHRAKELVNRILAFSRQSTQQRRDVLIAPVIKEACRLLRASTPATIELDIQVAEDIGMISADPSQIEQVLINLCTNAIQAIGDQPGMIQISLREIETGQAEQLRYHDLQPGRYVVLMVKDTGRGIPPEVLDRIFDPFYTTREVGAGSGMGLSVLHGIIVAHDGVIDVNSEPGKGSVFTIFFPRVRLPDGEDVDRLTAMPRGTETILFVDDEEDIVKMRTRMLSYLGYRVLSASGPEEALALFSANREQINLLITDHTMPRQTGLQLAAEISNMRPELPIILCSGYSEAVTTEEAREAGVRRFLAKPVDMRLLATAIREIFADHARETA